MQTIVAIIFMVVTFPFWLLGTIAYLIVVGLFYFVGIVFTFFLQIFLWEIEIADAFKASIANITQPFTDLFLRYDDVFFICWEFSRYDYPKLSLIIIGILIFYYYWLSDNW